MVTCRHGRHLLGFVTLALAALASGGVPQERMMGFSPDAARAQQQIEEKLQAIPSTEELERLHRFLTAEPHPAGSERNNELARHIAELWKQQG